MQHPTESVWPKALRLGWLPVVLITGLTARFWVSTYGSNYDWDSWKITADLMARGQEVYNGTFRYNYAPVWMWLLHALDVLAAMPAEAALAGFNTLVASSFPDGNVDIARLGDAALLVMAPGETPPAVTVTVPPAVFVKLTVSPSAYTVATPVQFAVLVSQVPLVTAQYKFCACIVVAPRARARNRITVLSKPSQGMARKELFFIFYFITN